MSRTADQYADALGKLLPDGEAWDWPKDGNGYALLTATAQELARIDSAADQSLVDAVAAHVPAVGGYMLAKYQAVADAATVVKPRKPFSVGSSVGDRLWSHSAPASVSPAPAVTLSLAKPLTVGSRVGSKAWSAKAKFYLVVSFDRSLIDSWAVLSALNDFKQAHVYLLTFDVPRI